MKQPDALNYCKKIKFHQRSNEQFGDWLFETTQVQIMAAHPAPIDFAWVNYYFIFLVTD